MRVCVCTSFLLHMLLYFGNMHGSCMCSIQLPCLKVGILFFNTSFVYSSQLSVVTAYTGRGRFYCTNITAQRLTKNSYCGRCFYTFFFFFWVYKLCALLSVYLHYQLLGFFSIFHVLLNVLHLLDTVPCFLTPAWTVCRVHRKCPLCSAARKGAHRPRD